MDEQDYTFNINSCIAYLSYECRGLNFIFCKTSYGYHHVIPKAGQVRVLYTYLTSQLLSWQH